MKKIILAGILMMGNLAASAQWITNGTYCMIDQSADACFWCEGGGGAPRGDCKKGYAGCLSAGYTVPIGSSVGGRTCTMNGFCMSYCDPTEMWREVDRINNPGLEMIMRQGGCLCDEWTTSGTSGQWRCMSGYYPDADPYSSLCHPCPSATFEDGYVGSGESDPESSAGIRDCFLLGGPYKDASGVFEVTEQCNYVP